MEEQPKQIDYLQNYEARGIIDSFLQSVGYNAGETISGMSGVHFYRELADKLPGLEEHRIHFNLIIPKQPLTIEQGEIVCNMNAAFHITFAPVKADNKKTINFQAEANFQRIDTFSQNDADSSIRNVVDHLMSLDRLRQLKNEEFNSLTVLIANKFKSQITQQLNTIANYVSDDNNKSLSTLLGIEQEKLKLVILFGDLTFAENKIVLPIKLAFGQ